MKNLLTDVRGVRVGHAQDAGLLSGVTAVLFDQPNHAAVYVGGGAPGSRQHAILGADTVNEGVDAIVLSGGSAFGLDAAGGAMDALRSANIGFPVGAVRVPIVAQAIIFDLLSGGAALPDGKPVYWHLGRAAGQSALVAPPHADFEMGSVGGGTGATTANFKGGVGSASATTRAGYRVGALAIVNAVGSVTIGDGPHFWAGAYEREGEFGGYGLAQMLCQDDLALRTKGGENGATPPSTTIAVVVTDAPLDKGQCLRLARMADDGLARAIRPVHAPMDGDTVFAVAIHSKTAEASNADKPAGVSASLMDIGATAADCLARAIARGVFEARVPSHGYAGPKAYQDAFAGVSVLR